MKRITIIVPLHEFNEKYLRRALESINTDGEKNNKYYQLLFVGPKDICDKSEKIALDLLDIEIRTLENNETDFITQINKAVFDCVTPYFTILEFDDKYTDIYFKNVQKIIQKHSDYSVLLPINEYVNTDEDFISFGNEIALDASFAEEIGSINLEELEIFMDFNCTGGLFKTEDFISSGGLKKSLKIACWYEFLMRMARKSKKIQVFPRIGYVHTVGRVGSHMDISRKEIDQKEGQFLIKLAKQEHFFKEDRNISVNDSLLSTKKQKNNETTDVEE